MTSFVPDTDSEDELPPCWEERATLDGKVYYANHKTETTQWTHPVTKKKKHVSGELPYGWERKILNDGKVLYADHINKTTTYTDPRLAFAVEEKDSPNDIRQRFDANSTALQVLHGRDLSGKIAVITGANIGIGYETARSLAFHGATVILGCRNADSGRAAVYSIKSERPNANICCMYLDLARLASVEDFADKVKQAHSQLHILILNAGACLSYAMSIDGIEETFQVNHLAHFYLVQLLQPLLLAAVPSRVVVVSSESHRFSFLSSDTISEERLSPKTSSHFVGILAYNDAKLCNTLFSAELERRLGDRGIHSNALHPGNMVSGGFPRHSCSLRLLYFLARPFTKSLQQAASTSVYCAVAPELEDVGGMYFNNCCRCQPSRAAEDCQFAEKLWTLSQEMLDAALLRRLQI